MRQSIKNRETTAALYPRLSRDDNIDGDSNSIQNQKKLLAKVAKEKGYTTLLTFVDDGVSGVTMDRPGFNEMMTELKKGYIGAVFVKDLSRLGRNYIEVGKLTEEFFPEQDIRLVAVSDGVDTAEGENDLNPIRNLFNEWYARDISKKRRISNKVKGNSGEPLSQPPYGYLKDPNNPKQWIVDPIAATVVRRIYQMALDGYGIQQIAVALTNDKIPNPTYYWQSMGLGRGGKKVDRDTAYWNHSTIAKTLSLQEYIGDVINFKTYSKSYKHKKRIVNPEENRAVFIGVHEPVVDRELWERVQAKRKAKRRNRPTGEGEKNMFSGLLRCATCGHNLNYHFNQQNHDIKYFNCSNYNSGHSTCTATHYIRVDFLEKVVLGEIRRLTKFASQYQDSFVQAVIGRTKQTMEQEKQRREKELDALSARDKELDRLFERMYEDNASGKITDERFAKMTKRYEREQGEIAGRVKILKNELIKDGGQLMTTDSFIAAVRKFTHTKKLTPRMVNELIDHIDVYHTEKVNGVKTQRLVIHYFCVGAIDIPEHDKIPLTLVKVDTRKGVAVSYSPEAV